MILYDTTPSASYLTHRNIKRLQAAARAQWGETVWKDVNEVAVGSPFTLRFYFLDGVTVTLAQAQAFVDAHDNAALMLVEQHEADAAAARTDIASDLDAAITYLGNSLANWAATDKDLFLRRVGRAVHLMLRIIRSRWF